MELRHLRYFAAVVQRNGYREASRHLHIAQASISQTVADLEQELGVRLFSRAGLKVVLTPEGAAFYLEAVRTLEKAESAINIGSEPLRVRSESCRLASLVQPLGIVTRAGIVLTQYSERQIQGVRAAGPRMAGVRSTLLNKS